MVVEKSVRFDETIRIYGLNQKFARVFSMCVIWEWETGSVEHGDQLVGFRVCELRRGQ